MSAGIILGSPKANVDKLCFGIAIQKDQVIFVGVTTGSSVHRNSFEYIFFRHFYAGLDVGDVLAFLLVLPLPSQSQLY